MGDLYKRVNEPEKALSYLENAYQLFNDIEYDLNYRSVYKQQIVNRLKELGSFTAADLSEL